jgi:hypothetical protein
MANIYDTYNYFKNKQKATQAATYVYDDYPDAWPDLFTEKKEEPKKRMYRVLNTGEVLEKLPETHLFVCYENYKVDMGVYNQGVPAWLTWPKVHEMAAKQYLEYPYAFDYVVTNNPKIVYETV